MSIMYRKKIRVAMLTDYPLDESELANGGVINAAYLLVKALSEFDDLELYILTPHSFINKKIYTKNGNTTVIHFPRRRRYLDHFVRYMNLRSSVRKLLREIKPDLIHAQGNAEYILTAVEANIPHIITIHGIFSNELPVDRATFSFKNYFKSRISLKLERYYLTRIRSLIAITDQVLDIVSSVNASFDYIRINNPIDSIFFEVENDNTGIEKTILFIAAIRQRKGLHILIDAYKPLLTSFPALKLHILGRTDWDQEYVDNLKIENEDLLKSGHIKFFGVVSQQTMLDEYAKATAFCLPSFAESQPMVIIQSFATGTPVISTNVGGIPQMIEHNKTGFIVSAGDSKSIELILKDLLTDENKRYRIAKAAKDAANELYAPSQIAVKTIDAYHLAIKKGKR